MQNFLRKHFFQRPLSIQLFFVGKVRFQFQSFSFHGDFLHTDNARAFRKLIYLDKNIISAVIFEEILTFCKNDKIYLLIANFTPIYLGRPGLIDKMVSHSAMCTCKLQPQKVDVLSTFRVAVDFEKSALKT